MFRRSEVHEVKVKKDACLRNQMLCYSQILVCDRLCYQELLKRHKSIFSQLWVARQKIMYRKSCKGCHPGAERHITWTGEACGGASSCFELANDKASSLLPLDIHNTPTTVSLHRYTDDQDGDATGFVVPLGGHVADPAVHGQRDWTRSRERPGRTGHHGL